MILLDTNVVSEMMRPVPNSRVILWLDEQLEWDIWISAVTVAEIQLGISLLPDGSPKELLLESSAKMFNEDFQDRCLPFDCEASSVYGLIVSERNRRGHPISVEDAQIAAIALTAGLTLATRNTRDFLDITGINLLNPFD
ncbi:MAG: type II toxin-antitoxin system VapC family toxin [Desulfobacteraceae bacterium]|nr:MAG: type II toxin-antitoxin system VapC family toxin [Desulfobacteraceae bacterium]